MAYFMLAYAVCYFAIGMFNAGLLFRRCGFDRISVYEFCVTLILTASTAACFIKPIYDFTPKYATLAGSLCVASELFFSLSGAERRRCRKMLKELQEHSEAELEIGELVSLVISAPAYLAALFLCYDKFFQ